MVEFWAGDWGVAGSNPAATKKTFFSFFFMQNIPKASEYFSKYLQTLQYFLQMLNISLDFLQVLENIQCFRIFFQVLTNTPGLLEVVKHFSRISKSHKKSQNLQNLQVFTNTPVLPEVAKHFSTISRSQTKSQKLQNIIPSIYKHSSTFCSC